MSESQVNIMGCVSAKGPKQFVCPGPDCSSSFKRKGDLNRHMKSHSDKKPYICEKCWSGFSQRSGLRIHMNTHSGARPYICGIGSCKSAFGDPSSCLRHRKEIHTCSTIYKCPHATCKSGIKRRSAFVAHIKKHGIDPSTVDINTMTSVADGWNKSKMTPADAYSSSTTPWLYQPMNDLPATTIPKYPAPTETAGRYYRNHTYLDDTTPFTSYLPTPVLNHANGPGYVMSPWQTFPDSFLA